ncbi:MAG: CPBP family intramembrane metalloprotease [Chloroflexi bacterium]|nr:CPBP family intramembrane metalloprotease [Chloroflexota bacterium]
MAIQQAVHLRPKPDTRRTKQAGLSTWYIVPSGVSALLVLYNTAVSFLPQAAYDFISFSLNFLLALLLVFWARKTGHSWQALGLRSKSKSTAVQWASALGIGLTVASPVLLLVMYPDLLTSILDTQRWYDMSTVYLVYRTVVRIPVGTAFFEEVIFRGVLQSLWTPQLGVFRASIISSLVFGLWHITPILELFQGSSLLTTPWGKVAGVVAGIFVTFIGGLLFTWLRYRHNTLYSAVVTHWVIDAIATLGPFVGARLVI